MSDINITVNDEIVNIDILDTPVLVNVVNSPGVPGAPGQGVPVGGTTGQVLKKLSNTNYDTYWAVDAGGISSIGLTMPSAFAVANSPLTANGTLAVTATGDTTQYIAGDGSLVAFPITGQAGTLVREVRNVTGATLTKGTVVYINGASGNKPTVAKALATGDATSAQTFGLIQADIPNNSNGYLVAFGDLDGLNTSAFAEGVQLYLSSTTAGGYTSTKQYAPNHLVYIGVVTRQHVNQGRIEVRIQNGYELDELHDVAAQTPSNNDGIFYNSSNSLWENKSIATALGYTPANAATTLTINGVTFDLSTNRTFTVGSVTGSGASGQVAYWTGASAVGGSNNLFWDNTNGRLGIGTNTPSTSLNIIQARPVVSFQDTTTGGLSTVFFGAFDDFLQLSSNRNPSTGIYSQIGKATSQISLEGANGSGTIRFFNTNTNNAVPDEKMRLFGTGNLLIQNAGTYSDGGQRLQVQGTTLLNGNVTFSSSTGMFWDAANGRLGIGTNAPIELLEIRSNANLGNGFGVINLNAGSGAQAQSYMQSNSGYLFMGKRSSAFATFKNITSGAAFLYSTSTDFALLAENGKMSFLSGSGSTAHMTLQTTGNLSLGSTTDSGERLQVTGTMKVTGLSYFVSDLQFDNTVLYWQGGSQLRNISNGVLRITNSGANDFTRLQFGGGTTSYPALQRSGAAICVTDATGTFLSNLLVGTTTDVASSKLTIHSTTQGFLPPRMTTTQKNAITSPAAGLVVYDTTLGKLCVYTTAWETITSI